MAESLFAQNINLDGIPNVRQLGGYEINGRQVRQNLLIRSANLSLATDSDIVVLHDTYHVAQVFDFRSTYEEKASPDRIIPDCKYYKLPCLDKTVRNYDIKPSSKSQECNVIDQFGEIILANLDSPQLQLMADNLYPMIVFDEDVQRQYATFLRTLVLLPEGHAALWHCTQGKDRAGCASAFLLAALGAERQLIVRDFTLSNVSYQPLIDRLVAKAKDAGFEDSKINVIYALIGVSIPNFEKVLDMIELRYGSIDNYLTNALHCDERLRERIRAKFLY